MVEGQSKGDYEIHSYESRHTQVRECELSPVQKLTLRQLLSIYGDFLYNLCDRTKEELSCKEKTVYEFLTLTWLGGDIVILNGPIIGNIYHPSTLYFHEKVY